MEKGRDKEKENIKHLVFSGGGPAGLITYGAVKYLAQKEVWVLTNIKSIYGCSIGAYIGIIISLGYEWTWLDDYFIKRPWEKVFSLTAQSFIDAYEQKGLLGEKIILESMKPLLGAKDLAENCTLQELYDFNQIDIHLYTTNINSARLEKVDLSHTTHPQLSVIKALYMSMSYPLAFKPVCTDDGACYIDGGLLNNFPLNDCLLQTGCEVSEVLAFKHIWSSVNDNNADATANAFDRITNESSIIDYMVLLTKKMQLSICTEERQPNIKNVVKCQVDGFTGGVSNWLSAVATEEMRAKLIEQGIVAGKEYIEDY